MSSIRPRLSAVPCHVGEAYEWATLKVYVCAMPHAMWCCGARHMWPEQCVGGSMVGLPSCETPGGLGAFPAVPMQGWHVLLALCSRIWGSMPNAHLHPSTVSRARQINSSTICTLAQCQGQGLVLRCGALCACLSASQLE